MHPILFHLGPVTFYSYGLMIALGFLSASALAGRRARALGLDPASVQNAALIVLLAGLVGGRLGYVIFRWDLYRPNPWEILRLDHGGLVFFGGFSGGLLGVVWAIHRARLPLLRTVDLLIPPMVVAHALGRIGCFLNGCCYGRFTTVPWGVVFPSESLPRHPTQLYESVALIGIFLGLKLLECRSPRPGSILLAYGLAYGVWRFCVEFLRGDTPPIAWGLTVFQLISLGMVAASGVFLLLRPSRKR